MLIVGNILYRFMLSLTSCRTCMVIDDQFNILPMSSQVLGIKPIPPKSVVCSVCLDVLVCSCIAS